MTVDFQKADWLNQPQKFEIGPDSVEIKTQPGTDFWQRSYYGFQNNNAPALLLQEHKNFSFSLTTEFDGNTQFDQSGIFIYIDEQNWCKASIEYENSSFSRLGSVVTNLGYSDWATTDIELVNRFSYRVSRRGPDFLIEGSADGKDYKQMRICHLHRLGDTDETQEKDAGSRVNSVPVKFGLYACSPNNSSFNARFYNFSFGPCGWFAHQTT